MRIGELAAATGVSRDAIRFYEKQGLLRGVQRRTNGYREYDAPDVTAIALIRTARDLGFPLTEIAAILPLMRGGRLPPAVIDRKLRERIAVVDARIHELQQLRALLAERLDAARCPDEKGPARRPGPRSRRGAAFS